jgi:hypothetical protein
MHPITALAKKTVETYVNTGKTPPVPKTLTPEMEESFCIYP